ncbi:MAG TPA: I78 family peptidase inhibitor [Novosphingobium sp.]|nr:I78 family peptidase inhibitor [Novosphingobium sp.]
MLASRPAVLTGVLGGGLLAATACTATTERPSPPPPPPAEVDCGAGQLGAYIGQPASEHVLSLIRQWRGDNPIRVLKPGSAMTMDYRPGRLNIFLDENDRIKEFKCN